jgi:hypothetical protein
MPEWMILIQHEHWFHSMLALGFIGLVALILLAFLELLFEN